MQRRFIALAAGALVLLAPLPRTASHAQMAAPTPTPATAAPASGQIPSARKLLTTMYAAVDKAGSAHIALSASFQQPGVEQVTMSGTEDVSSRHYRSIYQDRTVATPLAAGLHGFQTSEENIAVGHIQATTGEAGEPFGVWVCEPVPGNLAKSFFIVYRWKHVIDVVNHGPDTVDGQSVWDVTAVGTYKEKGGRTGHEKDLYFIAQAAPHYLVREMEPAEFDGPNGLIPYTLVTDYSNYGEPVHVSLPKVCRPKKKP